MNAIETIKVVVTLASVFLSGAVVGAWFVQRPARRRAREIELADNMRKRGER